MTETISAFGLETKYAVLAPDAAGAAEIAGYASVFGDRDGNGDIVEPGAFDASLRRLSAEGRSVKLLWQHDPAQPSALSLAPLTSRRRGCQRRAGARAPIRRYRLNY